MSPITFWIEFFKDPYSDKVKSLCEFVPEIKEAKEIYERTKSDPKARGMLRLREKATRGQVNALSYAAKQESVQGALNKARETVVKMLGRGLSLAYL